MRAKRAMSAARPRQVRRGFARFRVPLVLFVFGFILASSAAAFAYYSGSASGGAATTVASGSNGDTLGASQAIDVASTTGFLGGSETIDVVSSAGMQVVTCTGTSASPISFTGCTGGTGTLTTGNTVTTGAAAVAGSIAAATSFAHGTATATSTTLTWTAPTGYSPTGDTITQTTPSGTVAGTCANTNPSSGCTVTGLSPSTAYTWTLTYFFDSWQATTTTSATTSTPAITLGTTTGVTVGSTDTASGTGFPVSTAVSLSWDGARVPFTASTNSSGAFGPTNFIVPQAVAGSHTVGATAGIGYATSTLTVVPKITVNVGSGVAGTTASVSGTGFAPSTAPTATFDGALTLGGPGSTSTDTFGSFNDATFTIPSTTGTLAVTAGTGDTANFSFTVVSATGYTNNSSVFSATQTTSSMSGLVTVAASSAFAATSTTFTVYVDGITAVGTVDDGSNGKFGGSGPVATFGLPAGILPGTHLVTIINTTAKDFATASLTVTGFLTPSPTSGAPGTSVTVTGAAHTMSASGVTFSTFFDSTAEATGGTSGTSGATSSSFTVPNGWGTQLVYLEQTSGTDNGYFTPVVSFTVPEPTVTATPTGGFVSGHTVTLSGSGFADSPATLSATYAGSSVTLSSSTISGTGTFSGITFTLPTESADTYPLIVTDSKGNSFTVGINQTG